MSFTIEEFHETALRLAVMAYEINHTEYANLRTMFMELYAMGAAKWIVGDITVDAELDRFRGEHPEMKFDKRKKIEGVKHETFLDRGIHLN